jgi:ATP-dependent Lon protease
LIPHGNAKDLVDIPANIKQKLEIHPVKWIDEVLALALERQPEPLPEETKPDELHPASEGASGVSVMTH